jgi:hypothetical protein
MAATKWATIEQIATITGVTVDEQTRTLAVATIEQIIGLIEEVERKDVSDRDRYWLRQAVAFQAAWLVAQPDYLERNAVSSAGQDGQSATGANPEWLLLSGNARRSLKRLSWRGVRALAIDNRSGTGRKRLDVTSEEYDDSLPWRKL